MSLKNQIVIYTSQDGKSQIDVQFEQDKTVWLNQAQMASLFDTSPQNITMHLKSIFKEGELKESSTCKDFLHVQKEGKREIKRKQKKYNLDAIISVGYRIKTTRATQFRIWATNTLNEIITKGFSIREQRLIEDSKQLVELKRIVKIQEGLITKNKVSNIESNGILKIIIAYTGALDLLDDYDHQRLRTPEKTSDAVITIKYQEAKKAIEELGKQTQFEGFFGLEKDNSFKSSLHTISQTFDGVDLYPTLEEKAAHLLYFVTKNHSFTDGNKRIAAYLFVWFLDINNALHNNLGGLIVSNETLVALTLMIAESRAEDKEMMVKVVMNLMQRNHE